MPRKTAGEKGKQLRKAGAEWEWRSRYRVWDADRRIFLYPENWIEPELRLTPRFRESLHDMVEFIRAKRDAKTKRKRIRRPTRRRGVRVLLTGKNRTGALIAAKILASDLGIDLYQVDLSSIIDKYIGETQKNLGHVFDAAKKSHAALFFDEADALFGKRSEVKDSHDRYANVEINYLLQRIEEYGGITILATNKRSHIDDAFLRRLRYVLRVPPRTNARRT